VTPCGPGLRRTLATLPRFIKVLAPNAKLRSLVVPQEPPAAGEFGAQGPHALRVLGIVHDPAERVAGSQDGAAVGAM
jgi:hypothetical protein